MFVNFIKLPLIFAVFASFFLTACEKPIEAEKVTPLRSVRTIYVAASDYHKSYDFTAVVEATNRADLAFKIPGELTSFRVKQGDKVKHGDIIAKLDNTDLKVNLDEAQAHYNKAAADLVRAKTLLQTSYISASEFDQIRANAQSAKAKLATAKNNLSYSVLRASFDGVIAKVYSKNYQEINAKEAIVRLHDLSQIQLVVNIPESTMIHLQRNSAQQGIIATFQGITEQRFPLTFSEVSTVADEYSKTYEVIFTMEAPKDYVILPGMTASVSAQVKLNNNDQPSKPSFYLPTNTVLHDAKSHFVYVVEKHKPGIGEVLRKNVTIGNITGQGIEILSGLTAGEQVISAGMSKVISGTLVQLLP